MHPRKVLVDRRANREAPPEQQRQRLVELDDKGAHVYLCSGRGRWGRLHMKTVAVDRRVTYIGSANYTGKSKDNLEMVVRLTGSPAAAVQGRIRRILRGKEPAARRSIAQGL